MAQHTYTHVNTVYEMGIGPPGYGTTHYNTSSNQHLAFANIGALMSTSADVDVASGNCFHVAGTSTQGGSNPVEQHLIIKPGFQLQYYNDQSWNPESNFWGEPTSWSEHEREKFGQRAKVIFIAPSFEWTADVTATGTETFSIRMDWSVDEGTGPGSFVPFYMNSFYDDSGTIQDYGVVNCTNPNSATPDDWWTYDSDTTVGVYPYPPNGDDGTLNCFNRLLPSAIQPGEPEDPQNVFNPTPQLQDEQPLPLMTALISSGSGVVTEWPKGAYFKNNWGVSLWDIDEMHIKMRFNGNGTNGRLYIRNLKFHMWYHYTGGYFMDDQTTGHTPHKIGQSVVQPFDERRFGRTPIYETSDGGMIDHKKSIVDNIATNAFWKANQGLYVDYAVGGMWQNPGASWNDYGDGLDGWWGTTSYDWETAPLRDGTEQLRLKTIEFNSSDMTNSAAAKKFGTDPTNTFIDEEGEIKMSQWDDYKADRFTVLCTELYHQGKLDKDVYMRDKEVTDTWMKKRPLLKAGYLCFAHWPLWLLRNKKEFAEKYMHHVVLAFSNYYADKHPSTKKKYKKNNWVGKSMMIFGFIFFPPLGLLTKLSKNKKYRLILSTITTAIWFIPLLAYSLAILIYKYIKGENNANFRK